MYLLVRELADDGIPVVVSCRVLGLARQPYYRWLEQPITDDQLDGAWLANAVFDAHRDDPEFGYRFLADEVRHHDEHADVSDRVVWRICRDNGWWSRFGKPGVGAPGPDRTRLARGPEPRGPSPTDGDGDALGAGDRRGLLVDVEVIEGEPARHRSPQRFGV